MVGDEFKMNKVFHIRNVVLLLLGLLVVWCALFAYRKNNVCSADDHPIQSGIDAIEVAKRKIVKDRSFSSDSFGSAPEFVDLLDETENCCGAARIRTIFGVIVWIVDMRAKASARYRDRTVHVEMSNCGEIFGDDSYKDAE